MKPYLYLPGLEKLAKKLKGNEVVHIGIRPYGFHAGNVLSLVVYPYLLCREMRKNNKEVNFKFKISINDYEQDFLDGPDFRKYPFNIYPKNSSLQFMPDEAGCCKDVVDHWQPIIESNILNIKKTFPEVTIDFIRNSSLKNKYYFKSLLLETLKNPEEQAKIFAKYSGKEVLKSPIQYAGVICPKCNRAHGKTTVYSARRILWECNDCGFKNEGKYESYNYWWYHKAMLTARLKILKVQVAMSGGDHYSEGDYNIRRKFMHKYFRKSKEPVMLFCPTLIARDGQKMSKSRNNSEYTEIKKLIEVAASNYKSEVMISDDMIKKVKNEKEYYCIF
jgi:lysyl-tRNA synthetase class I